MKSSKIILQNKMDKLVRKFETGRRSQLQSLQMLEEMRRIKRELSGDSTPTEDDIMAQQFQKMAITEKEMGAESAPGHRPPY